jgi:hypothetical protein
MHRSSLIFMVISGIGVASMYNLTTFEAYAQRGGIMCLIPNSAQDIYLTGQSRAPVETPLYLLFRTAYVGLV